MMYALARRTMITFLLILLGAGQSFADEKKQKNSDVDTIGNRNINRGSINFTSLEKEIELGRKMAAEIERQAKLIQDPVVNEYVNRLGQNLVRNSDAKVPFTIKIIESEDINAFALPGGFFFVNTGLILAADDEAELAGVMAHEIAHVAARHGTENASKSQLLDLATIPLIFLGGPAGYGLRQAAGLLVPMQFLKFSRKAETEADYLGVQYMYKAGYDPSAAVTFFEKLQAREKAKPGAMSKLFSTHPPTGDRVAKTKEQIERLPEKDEYAITTSEFMEVRRSLLAAENRTAPDGENRPTLKRRPQRHDGPPNATEPEDKDKDQKQEEDARPTLKRRHP